MSGHRTIISIFCAVVLAFTFNMSLSAYGRRKAGAGKVGQVNKTGTVHRASNVKGKKLRVKKQLQKARTAENHGKINKKRHKVYISHKSSNKGIKDKYKDLTLKKLFPEKSFWGPSARGMAFSSDGRYGGYLYRPYKERRHGNDIYLYDTKTGQIKRITSVSVMAKFQESTRKVQQYRIKQAQKFLPKLPAQASKANVNTRDKLKGKTGKGIDRVNKMKLNQRQLMERGNWVTDKDADNKQAPKYSGISSFVWSPKGEKILFVSQGDVYSYDFGSRKVNRITNTGQIGSDIKWLPDASGFICTMGGYLYKVGFAGRFPLRITPKFPAGQRMSGYHISPDGKGIVFVTTRYERPPRPPHQVSIATYRSRFMQTSTHVRQVADDPSTPKDISVYIYRMFDLLHENTRLTKVFAERFDMPRDYISVPNWSLDSTRITFAVYRQKDSNVRIFESKCLLPDNIASKKNPGLTKTDRAKAVTKTDAEAGRFQRAMVVHRFLHTGGPSTPPMIKPQYIYDNHRIVYLSEETGFRHLHILNPTYQTNVSLTTGRFEVYPSHISKNHRWMLVISTKEHPWLEEVYRADLVTGKLDKLSIKPGRYIRAAVSPDGRKVLADYLHYGQPMDLNFVDVDKHSQRALTDSNPPIIKEITKPRPKFFSYKNRHGQDIYGQMFKPDDWKKTDKRPLLIYLYGGPLGKQKQVLDGYYQSSAYFFAYYMAKKHGWVTCTIDPRGNSGYGGLFERSNFEQVGKPQVEDVVDAVKYFVKNEGVDPKRVALHGWSFGGFQTQMCLYTKPDVFAAGIAGAGPTEWQNYNAWYTTGTVAPSHDVKKFSLIPLAKNLKAKLLLMHGVEDDNVLFQDTIKIYRELLRQHKETLVELFIDPTGKHGLGGDVKTLARFRKYEEFLLRTVGEGKPGR